MRKAVIVSAVRAGVGSYNGQWTPITPEVFGGHVIKEAVKRAGVNPAEIEDVIMGNLYAQHGNIARIASLEADLPLSCSATTIDRQCGSSVQTIYTAAMGIMAGDGDAYVACGMEHMTREPWQLAKPSVGYALRGPEFMLTRLAPDRYGNERMGFTAEAVAARYNLTRQQLDEFAYASQMKAAKAIQQEKFKEQILPIEVPAGRGATKIVVEDEIARPNITMEQLARLKPAFQKDGVVTAGNSCPWSDGASALVIMSEERAKACGIKPLATIRSFATAGLDPKVMGLGPIYAVPKCLKKAGITVNDLDWIELNEAFAAQAVACIRDLKLPEERVNPYGGAIALGHPLGATGAILTTKAVYALQENNLRFGLITMCIGGGQGAALLIEREN